MRLVELYINKCHYVKLCYIFFGYTCMRITENRVKVERHSIF